MLDPQFRSAIIIITAELANAAKFVTGIAIGMADEIDENVDEGGGGGGGYAMWVGLRG